jgi:hypothetical protein
MGDIIVKVPTNEFADYDFIAFSFNGQHSYEDFGIVRTSDGDRYESKLVSTIKDKTVDVPNGNGKYYFTTNYDAKIF